MDTLLQDIRYGWRTLARSPGFTATAALTLALGIGANTAIFSVVDGVLLKPLPWTEPDRLVSLWPEAGFARGNFDLLEQRAQSYQALGGVGFGATLTLSGDGEPVRLEGMTATPSLLPVLGITPAVGRGFLPEEERPGSDPVAMLSWGLWQSRYAGDPAIVGRTITLDGGAHTVVGILPPDFSLYDRGVDIWLPAPRVPGDLNSYWSGGGSLRVIGRLRDGVTPARASTELRALAPEMRDAYPWDMPTDFGVQATVHTLRDGIVGDSRSLFAVLLAAVGLVLLIACANVANLVLVRAAGRSRELAIRASIGAGRQRIARQLLTESGLLAALGGLGGVILAIWGVPALVGVLPPETPRLDAIAIDLRVLGFAGIATLLTAALFGVIPAIRAARTDLSAALREGGRGDDQGAGARRLSSALVVAEVALAVVLVTGAGLVLRSFAALLDVDPGFRPESVVSASVAPPSFRFADADARRGFYDDLTTRLAALPGVRGAATTSALPFGGRNYGTVFLIEGRPIPAGGDWPIADVRAVVQPAFFDVMGVPLVDGRAFTDADRTGTDPVAVLSAAVARENWPDGTAVGRRIRFPADTEVWITIVGVVDDVKWAGLAEDTRSALYLSSRQFDPGAEARLVIRATGSTAAVAGGLFDVVASIDDATPVSDIRTLRERIADSAAAPRFASVLLTVFAALALLLGAIGIYGVIAWAVGRRIREFGVRMALGARAGEVRALVLRQGLVLGLTGVAIGLLAAAVATRALRSLLFGIGPVDPVTFTAVPVLLVAVALVAAWIPARRATRVAPMAALRAD